MATAGEIVTRALKLIAVTAQGQSPSATEMADGLLDLWRMVTAFDLAGVALPRPLVPWTVNDAVMLADPMMEGIEAALAVRMAPQYGKQAREDVAMIARRFETTLRGLTSASMVADMPALLRGKTLYGYG